MLIPAAKNKTYAITLNRIARRTRDIKLQICLGMVRGTTTYTIRGFWKSATERLRSLYEPTHKIPNITSRTAVDC